jgi:hypothetical protein
VGNERDLQPIATLLAPDEQEPCEVVVLSLVDTGKTKLPTAELLLGAQMGKFPVAPQPDHDISAAAEHRMNLAVSHLNTLGCKASGLISDEDLANAVRSETRSHDYDRVILATGRHEGSWLARSRGRDPVHKLRRQWGQRLVIFSPGSGAKLGHPRDGADEKARSIVISQRSRRSESNR